MTSEAYGAAFETGFRSTVRFLQSRGANLDRAEEAAQAAWARGWQYRHELRDESLLRCWIDVIAIRLHRRSLAYESRYCDLRTDLGWMGGINAVVIDARKLLNLASEKDRLILEQWMDLEYGSGITPRASLVSLRARQRVRNLALNPGTRGTCPHCGKGHNRSKSGLCPTCATRALRATARRDARVACDG